MSIDQRFLSEIKGILQKARSQAYRAINATMVEAYWQIGKRIVEEDQGGKLRAGYREGTIKDLSIALTTEFGKGFSVPKSGKLQKVLFKYSLIFKNPTHCVGN